MSTRYQGKANHGFPGVRHSPLYRLLAGQKKPEWASMGRAAQEQAVALVDGLSVKFTTLMGRRSSDGVGRSPFAYLCDEVSRQSCVSQTTCLGHPLCPGSTVAWAPPTKSELRDEVLSLVFYP